MDLQAIAIQDVSISDDTLSVDLADGRSVSVPLGWFPRLWHGTETERSKWRLIGGGMGIHWPDLDENISAEGLILGKASQESQRSLNQWLASRA
jgi:hypothetical protein